MVDRDTPSENGGRIDRRRFLHGAGATGAIALAGCTGGSGSESGSNGGNGSNGSSGDSGSNSSGGTAGSAGGGSTTTLQVWELFSGGDGEAFNQLISNFNDAHDNIQLKTQGTDWNDYYGKLYTSMSGGNAPDLCVIHVTRLLKFAPALVDLSEVINSKTKNAYIEKVWSKNEVDGKRVSLPLDTHPCGLYYNKDIFDEAGLDPESPPANWKEFKNAANTVTSKTDANAFLAQSYEGPTMLRTWFAFLEQKGGKFLNDDKTGAAFDSDTGLEVMKTWKKMTGEWGWDEADTSANRGDKSFRNGNAAMSYQGTWYVNTLKDSDFDWGMTKPFVADGLKKKRTWANSHSLAVPQRKGRSDEKTQAAVTAAEWITQNSTLWGKIAGHLPAATKVLNSQAMKNSQWWDVTLKQFMEMANNNQIDYLPRTQKQSEFKRPIYKNIQQVYSQSKAPQKALDDAASRVNSILG